MEKYMTFRDFLINNIVYLDGGMGTLLQQKGLKPGEFPETWNKSHSDIITDIHRAYFDAGSNVVSTNTFGANSLKFSGSELEEIIRCAVENARAAAKLSSSQKEKFVALDIGPLGRLLKPLGDLDFEDAVDIFKKTVALGVKYGVDLVFIETMNDCYETKAALLAAKEASDLPVLVSNAYGEDGKLMTGASPAAMVAMLEGMGADAIGANCSLGPRQLKNVMMELLENASVPVIMKPNAGLPRFENGKTVFDVSAVEFAGDVRELVEKGVRLIGGCCGTTPEYIKELNLKTKGMSPAPLTDKGITVVSSYTHAVKFDATPILIGERINPTGKKRFKQALINNEMDYLLGEGIKQQDKGVHILDVNVGLPEIDEVSMLTAAVCELQAVSDLPLQIDTASPEAMEKALRRYNGKAMVNSVNGKEESMEKVFPLVKKYGGLVVALTLDETGIPATAEGRVEIAKKILAKAAEYGISSKDIIFDTLAMTISADKMSANVTLEALRTIKNDLGCHTSLGVSNVSFGLPQRDAVNSTFFALSLFNGLSAAIMNPYSVDMMKAYYAYKALRGLDDNCSDYIKNADSFATVPAAPAQPQTGSAASQQAQGTPGSSASAASSSAASVATESPLMFAIVKGLKERATELTKELLKERKPLELVNDEIIPALNIVGEGFEKKTVFLPSLLMSAEAASGAFEIIKAAMPLAKEAAGDKPKGRFVIATVHGDIHDIGKNIVKLLMENYGFDVTDLGKDVPPEVIVEKVIEIHAPLCGLSALMTTTVPSMEETIKQLKEKAPWCKVVVGGAVLTRDYAESIGADRYCHDAMETVRYAEEVLA
ncbi:MAG: homocysteine S-methyltransferase family protein [Eubacteriales bacterium]|nr:homocysteine S-methyltransferase family protein [Eubacteriales bacterium]